MATNEQLLKLTTKGAIVRMVNDENGTLFNGGQGGELVVSPPLNVGGVRTEVELSIRRQLSKNDILPYQGQVAFRYNRLDVAGTLGSKIAGFRPEMPTSTQQILDELSHRTGIKFELDDFVLEDITRTNAAPYVLKAKSESLRWVGQVNIALMDLTDLSTYLPGGLPTQTQTLVFADPGYDHRHLRPYMNGTVWQSSLASLINGYVCQNQNDGLATFIKNTVQGHNTYVIEDQSNSIPIPATAWVYNTSTNDFQLNGAKLVDKAAPIANYSSLFPAATLAVHVQLGSLSSMGNKTLMIPYTPIDFSTSELNDAPRFKQSAVVNHSDGTPWNIWLNGLSAPSIITSLPSNLNFNPFNEPAALRWVCRNDGPFPNNLFNAVVQYNGSHRPYDVRPFYEHCNRILVLSLSEYNRTYQGNFVIHYRAPIIINETPSDAAVGMPYSYPLNPREGTAPYTVTKISGNWAAGHSLTSDFKIEGTASNEGNYTAVVEVKDAAGVKVRYTLGYRVVIRDIQILISPPQGTVGQLYECTFEVVGGVPGYSYRLIDTNNTGELTLVGPTTPKITGTFVGTPGRRYYVLEAADSRGVLTTLPFNIEVN